MLPMLDKKINYDHLSFGAILGDCNTVVRERVKSVAERGTSNSGL